MILDRIRKGPSGPYIGPRGGKWANPEHTVSWRPPNSWSGVVHTTPPSVQPKAHPFIEAERAIRGRDVECLVAMWGRRKKKSLRRVGTDTFVPVYKHEVAAMRKAGNAILTHNHPTDAFFSPQDVSLARDANLAEIRVVTSAGVWSMKRPERGWDEVETILTKAWQMSLGVCRRKMDDIIDNGGTYTEERWGQIVKDADNQISQAFTAGGYVTFSKWT